jgi:hypothetical protein
MPNAHRIGRTTFEDTDDDEPLIKFKDDDDEPLFKFKSPPSTEVVEPQSTSPPLAAPPSKRVRREKRVPASALDKATANIRQGGTKVDLMGTPIEPDMDYKLAALIEEVMRRPHVVSVELQASMISTFK